jgi:hypothetical protein
VIPEHHIANERQKNQQEKKPAAGTITLAMSAMRTGLCFFADWFVAFFAIDHGHGFT